jgi:hypothetical protein
MVDDWSTACSDALLVSQVISQANSRGKAVRNLPFMDATRLGRQLFCVKMLRLRRTGGL